MIKEPKAACQSMRASVSCVQHRLSANCLPSGNTGLLFKGRPKCQNTYRILVNRIKLLAPPGFNIKPVVDSGLSELPWPRAVFLRLDRPYKIANANLPTGTPQFWELHQALLRRIEGVGDIEICETEIFSLVLLAKGLGSLEKGGIDLLVSAHRLEYPGGAVQRGAGVRRFDKTVGR